MDEFEVKVYEKLIDSKHHYDNLSWFVGVPILTIAGGLLAYIPTLKDADRPTQIFERLTIAVFIWLILASWHSIYQRNRIWGEAANEALRDIERAHHIRGAGIAFMLATLEKKVVLKNTDEHGKLRADPFTEEMRAGSMHHVIPRLAKLVGVLAGLACLLP